MNWHAKFGAVLAIFDFAKKLGDVLALSLSIDGVNTS